jgi:hypothetical protein
MDKLNPQENLQIILTFRLLPSTIFPELLRTVILAAMFNWFPIATLDGSCPKGSGE